VGQKGDGLANLIWGFGVNFLGMYLELLDIILSQLTLTNLF
jgi:hypothetical protein